MASNKRLFPALGACWFFWPTWGTQTHWAASATPRCCYPDGSKAWGYTTEAPWLSFSSSSLFWCPSVEFNAWSYSVEGKITHRGYNKQRPHCASKPPTGDTGFFNTLLFELWKAEKQKHTMSLHVFCWALASSSSCFSWRTSRLANMLFAKLKMQDNDHLGRDCSWQIRNLNIFRNLEGCKKNITILFTTSKFAPKAIQHTQKFWDAFFAPISIFPRCGCLQ